MGSVHASSDGKLVLGTADTQVKYWPIADYAAYKTASSNGMTGAQWQPGTAVGLGLPKGGGSDVTEHILMRLSDGASVTFEVTGTLTASVRLR